MKKYQIIYADPPWYSDFYEKGTRITPYSLMKDKDICNLPVKDISDKNCILFLWVTYPKLMSASSVIENWGFTYKTVAFTWVKLNPSVGNPLFIMKEDIFMGLGSWTRANPEICLLATRGHPHRVSKSVRNVVLSYRREHSRKPDEIRDRIVELCGDLSRIELFARQKTPGWDVWGNEVESCINLSP